MRCFSVSLLLSLLALSACSSGGNSSGSSSQPGSSSSTSSSSSSSSSGTNQTAGSHHPGENCLTSGCHDGTSGAEKFTVGGTIYRSNGQPNTSAEIKLYVHNTNTLSASLLTDESGNFYTSEVIDGLSTGNGQLVTGVDVEVHGSNGITTMPGLITSGACYGCHGQSNGVIVVN